jgi:hypothetical protein
MHRAAAKTAKEVFMLASDATSMPAASWGLRVGMLRVFSALTSRQA